MAIKGAPYTQDLTAEIGRIETRRLTLGVTVEDLAVKAGMTARTLYNIRRRGRAFRRQIRALSHALRSLEQEERRAETLFPFGISPVTTPSSERGGSVS